MSITYEWRGEFTSSEANALHAEAFATRVFSDDEWDWRAMVAAHSLGWVVARDDDGELVGFVNVLWDGLVHAWIQDVMVAVAGRASGRGHTARGRARPTGRGPPGASGCTSTSTTTCATSTSAPAGSADERRAHPAQLSESSSRRPRPMMKNEPPAYSRCCLPRMNGLVR